MKKQNSVTVSSLIRDAYYTKIEEAHEAFVENAKNFARRGNERSDVEGFDFEGLQTQIKASKGLTVKHRNQALSELRKKNKDVEKISDLLDTHQRDMEQCASGSTYHQHLADLEAELGM